MARSFVEHSKKRMYLNKKPKLTVTRIVAVMAFVFSCMGCSTYHGILDPTTPVRSTTVTKISHGQNPHGETYITDTKPFYSAYKSDEAHKKIEMHFHSDKNSHPYYRVVQAGSDLCEANPFLDFFNPKDYEPDFRLASAAHFDKSYRPNNGVLKQYRHLPLSPGDLVNIEISEGEEFSGKYIVNHNGMLTLPYMPPLQVNGYDIFQVEERLKLHLIMNEIFRPQGLKASVRPLEWAAIQVYVKGAVFNPGRQLINQRKPDAPERAMYGQYPAKRYLSEAIRSASGARPDADLEKVILVRHGWKTTVDLSGIFDGGATIDMPLIAGDQVVVPTKKCFQPELVRPSQITPKGIRMFISNLIQPAPGNAATANGKYSSNVPYGTRLLQAAVSGNCVGGIQLTNATRKVILVSQNPLTGQSEVIERSIEALMRGSDRDKVNPYILPNDAIACYDSNVTNARDIASFISEVANPIKLFWPSLIPGS